MRFQFDGNQAYQLRAIEAVADLFRGQPRITIGYNALSFGELFGPLANRIDLDESQLLANLHAVQQRNALPLDPQLELIEETIRTFRAEQTTRFANFSVEMETGTGKTYVYLRTALELHRRYGLRKFIVVVPSVAIREGVLKTLKITQDHLRGLYDNVPYRSTVYDSKSIGKVRQFAQSDCVEMLVMTIDSFNKDDNVIRQSTDRLQGATPIYLVQAARPVLFLDEPQNMESEGRIKALASLHPLFALRYSATHRNPYNLVYRLTPFEAYRQGLVKKIEVASVIKEDDYNQVFLRLDEVRSAKRTIQAKIALHQRMANGTIKEKAYLFKPGDSLQNKADRPEYATFVLDEINAAEQTVRFTTISSYNPTPSGSSSKSSSGGTMSAYSSSCPLGSKCPRPLANTIPIGLWLWSKWMLTAMRDRSCTWSGRPKAQPWPRSYAARRIRRSTAASGISWTRSTWITESSRAPTICPEMDNPRQPAAQARVAPLLALRADVTMSRAENDFVNDCALSRRAYVVE